MAMATRRSNLVFISPRRRSISRLVLTLLVILLCIGSTNAFATPSSSGGQRRPARPGRGSSTSSGGGGGRGGGRGGRGGRGRGRGESKSKTWHALRKSGVKSKNRSKAPRWEKEGDTLYHAVVAQADGGGAGLYGGVGKATNIEEARDMLSRLASNKGDNVDTTITGIKPAPRSTPNKPNSVSNKKEKKKVTPPPHTVWGSLPVGPVLRKSLLDASLLEPTAVQSAAFSVLTTGQNAIIASPTGTGKSLAYLLPLLASSKGRGVPCSIMVVTPTVELATQLQREVDKLWPPLKGKGGEEQSAMHVVGFVSGKKDDKSVNAYADIDADTTDNKPELLPQIGNAPILAGTPRSLRKLLSEMQDVLSDRNGDNDLKSAASNLRSCLKAVVLDEADRLLRTEGKARDIAEVRQMRESGEATPSAKSKKKQSRRSPKPQAEQLLYDLPVPLEKLQIVCASATVGRTLRRQLMDLLQTPSIDKTAVLVTAEGDVRTGKNIDKRKSSLVPDTLGHKYRLLPAIGKKAADGELGNTVAALHETMQMLDPSHALVFPGKLGVEAVQKELTACGLKCILGLKDVHLAKEDADTSDSWEVTQVFVVGDKFGRGLDVPGVRYVFLLSPPSSAAGYTHLSGRTGRNGKEGTAITFTRPREAHKLVAIADALGLSFEELAPNGAVLSPEKPDIDIDTRKEGGEESARPKEQYSWADLSGASLKRKTVAELTDYLKTYGISLDQSGRILKADLVAAINDLHK